MLLFDEAFRRARSITRIELQRLFLDLRRRSGKTALFVTTTFARPPHEAASLLHQALMELILPPKEFRRADSPEARAFLAGLEEEAHV